MPQKTRLGPPSAVFADPPAPSPKPPDPPLLLLSCVPACVQKWGEPFPAPLPPPLKGGVGAAPLFPWDSEKQTNPQGSCHLFSLPPRTLLSSAGFSFPTWGLVNPSISFCPWPLILPARRGTRAVSQPLGWLWLAGFARAEGRQGLFFRQAVPREPTRWSWAPHYPSACP